MFYKIMKLFGIRGDSRGLPKLPIAIGLAALIPEKKRSEQGGLRVGDIVESHGISGPIEAFSEDGCSVHVGGHRLYYCWNKYEVFDPMNKVGGTRMIRQRSNGLVSAIRQTEFGKRLMVVADSVKDRLKKRA